jgi:hypothetical protein
MSRERTRLPTGILLAATLAYCAASLFHFAHNAEFLDAYPNLPAWLTRPQVYWAWLGVTAVGVLGLLLVRTGHALVGLAVLALYAALGFDGLTHYAVAPVSAHTAVMNLSIGLEVAMAALLLAVVLLHAIARLRSPHPG